MVANYAIPGSETKWLDGMRLTGYADLAHVAYGDVSDFDAMGKMISMIDRKSTRLNSSHERLSRMPSSA